MPAPRKIAEKPKFLRIRVSPSIVQNVVFTPIVKAKGSEKTRALKSIGEEILGRELVAFVDAQVYALYGERLFAKRAGAFARALPIVLPRGEGAKSPAVLSRILTALAHLKAGRNSHTVIAIGGGSTLDVVGMASSIYHRGLSLIHVPTTLLAMVDATVGGKTAVNAFGVKNILGTFYAPAISFIDVSFLETLSRAQIRDGLVEAVKMAFLAGAREFTLVSSLCASALEGNASALRLVIELSVRVKARYVKADFFDQGKRMELNLGHTLGHAIEARSGYRVSHGSAVGVGILFACALSESLGLAQVGNLALLKDTISQLGITLPKPKDPSSYLESLWELILRDKKRRRSASLSQCRFVLPIEPGKVAFAEVKKRDYFRILSSDL